MGAGHLGLGDDIFSSVCWTFFLEIPDAQCVIWVTGHLAIDTSSVKMPS